MDDFLLRNTPWEPVALDPAVAAARTALARALPDLLAIEDSSLERPWMWNGGENDFRYGFYRQVEAFTQAAADARQILTTTDPSPCSAVAPLGAATQARWDLHGAIADLRDASLDADPGRGEWTVRQTLAHIVNGQRAYAWFTAWWVGRRNAPIPDAAVLDKVGSELPDESTEAPGTLLEIRGRFDDILDLGASRLAPLDGGQLAYRARWSGVEVTVGFRLWRWVGHLREHTLQVDKTLLMLGQEPREVARLVRLVLAAYGELEAAAFGREPQVLALPGADGRSAADVVRDAAAGLPALAKELRAVAEAPDSPEVTQPA